MKILITGANGFIGSSLLKLLQSDHEMVGVDNFSSMAKRPELNILHLDISNFADFSKLKGHKFDVIYHCAASFANEMSVEFPVVDFQSNAFGTLMTLEFAKACGCQRFIYLGSSSSYGPGDEVNLPFSESAALNPQTPYAISKHVGEMYATFYQTNFDVFIFRLFNVYGPGDFPGLYRNAIPNMFERAVKHGNVRVLGADSTRDFTYIQDVIHVLRACIEWDAPGIYNLCTNQETKITNVAASIRDCLGIPLEIEVRERRSWDAIARRVGNNEKLLAKLHGFKFSSFDEGIKTTVKWLVGNAGIKWSLGACS